MNSSEYPSQDKYRDIFSTSIMRKDLNRKAVRGGATVMGAEIGASLLRIGSMAILARLLLPEDFGLLAMVTSLTVFAERFKDMGLGDATVQAKDINHEQVSILFWINLSICMGIALFLAFLSKAVAWFYNDPRLLSITLVIASTFFFSGLVIQHQAVLRRQLRFGVLALIQLYSIVFSLLVAIVLAYYGFGYWALVAREFSRALFVVIGTWFTCPWQPGLPQRRVCITPLLNFGKNVTGFNLIYFLSHSLDRILIGKLQGPYWVGLYTNAYQLVALPVSQIQYPVNTIALPALSVLQGEPSEFRIYYEKMLHFLTFFSMPVVAFVALFGDMIVGLLLGPKWMNAVPIFQVLAVGAFVEPLVHTAGPALVASGRTKEYFRIGAINALALLCCLIIGSFWGTIGVAIGYAVSVYLAVFVSLVYGLRHTPVRIAPLLRSLIPNCFYSLLTAFVFFCVRYALGWSLQLLWLPFFAIAGASMYLGLWLAVPGGRNRLWSYWNLAIRAMPWRK